MFLVANDLLKIFTSKQTIFYKESLTEIEDNFSEEMRSHDHLLSWRSQNPFKSIFLLVAGAAQTENYSQPRKHLRNWL